MFNNNESATILKSKIFHQLNRASAAATTTSSPGSAKDSIQIQVCEFIDLDRSKLLQLLHPWQTDSLLDRVDLSCFALPWTIDMAFCLGTLLADGAASGRCWYTDSKVVEGADENIFRAEWAAPHSASPFPCISGPERYVGLPSIGPSFNASILKPTFSFLTKTTTARYYRGKTSPADFYWRTRMRSKGLRPSKPCARPILHVT